MPTFICLSVVKTLVCRCQKNPLLSPHHRLHQDTWLINGVVPDQLTRQVGAFASVTLSSKGQNSGGPAGCYLSKQGWLRGRRVSITNMNTISPTTTAASR